MAYSQRISGSDQADSSSFGTWFPSVGHRSPGQVNELRYFSALATRRRLHQPTGVCGIVERVTTIGGAALRQTRSMRPLAYQSRLDTEVLRQLAGCHSLRQFARPANRAFEDPVVCRCLNRTATDWTFRQLGVLSSDVADLVSNM